MKKNIYLFILIFTIPFLAIAQKGYNIEVKIKDFKVGEKITLGYYFGNGKYIQDTTRTNSNGVAVFKGDKPLDKGMYMIIFANNTKFFDLPISTNDKIVVETDTIGWPTENLVVKEGAEVARFYDFNRALAKLNKNYAKFDNIKPTSAKNKDSVDSYLKAIEPINKELKAENENFIKTNSKDLLTYILNFNREIEVPEPPTKQDSTFKYYYYRNHFWDNLDFNDERIVRTPLFTEKLNFYITKVLPPVSDTILKEATSFIAKMKNVPDMRKYTIHTFTTKHENPEIMGLDAVFVGMVETYYLDSTLSPWISKEQRDKIVKRAGTMSNAILGRPAGELIGRDSSRQLNTKKLSDVKAKYTIVVFWESTCGHCQKTLPLLDSLYKAYLKPNGIEVYAMSIEHEDFGKKEITYEEAYQVATTKPNYMKSWKAFIKKHDLTWINVHDPFNESDLRKKYDIYSTPVIYILDKDKKIAAKRLAVDQIKDFLERSLERDRNKK